jgi:WD40 repeat protein
MQVAMQKLGHTDESCHNSIWANFNGNNSQHDAQFDYYGKRLATCSSDRTIKVFDVEGESNTLVDTLKGYVQSTTSEDPFPSFLFCKLDLS